MSFTVDAVYDGTGLRLDAPLDLAPNTKVKVTVEVDGPSEKRKSFLETARLLKLKGPADWSENVDRYLYGDDPSKT